MDYKMFEIFMQIYAHTSIVISLQELLKKL